MKRMRPGNNFAACWFRVGVAAAWMATAGISFAAQSQGKAPAKPPANSAPHEREDPLAPLLQQANEAVDKMDFTAALDPLQKYIAQRPDEPYPHFQLGYAYVGLKRPADAKAEFSRAIALDPKMAPAYLNLGLVEMDSDPAAAAEAFRHAAELQPAESRPRFLMPASLWSMPENFRRPSSSTAPRSHYRRRIMRLIFRWGASCFARMTHPARKNNSARRSNRMATRPRRAWALPALCWRKRSMTRRATPSRNI